MHLLKTCGWLCNASMRYDGQTVFELLGGSWVEARPTPSCFPDPQTHSQTPNCTRFTLHLTKIQPLAIFHNSNPANEISTQTKNLECLAARCQEWTGTRGLKTRPSSLSVNTETYGRLIHVLGLGLGVTQYPWSWQSVADPGELHHVLVLVSKFITKSCHKTITSYWKFMD